MKKLLASWFRSLTAFENTPVKQEFSIVDPTSADSKGLSTVTLAVSPSDGQSPTMVSLFFQASGVKLFEKKYQDDNDAQIELSSMAQDLNEAATLSKEGKVDEAKNLVSSLIEKYKRSSDNLTQPTVTPTMTQASQEPLQYKGFLLKKLPNGSWQATQNELAFSGDSIDVIKAKVDNMLRKAYGKKLIKSAEIIMQNLFFSTPDEALQYQEKMKELQGPETGEGKPLWEQVGGEEVAPSNETVPEEDSDLAPSSLSFDRLEKSKVKQDKDIGKRIKDQVKTEVESALEQKSASVFGPEQEELVEALKKNGRNWDEIKKIFVKDLSYNEDDTAVFLDSMRSKEESGAPKGLPFPPKPPEDLVSPETHDKLVKEIEDKKEPKLDLKPEHKPLPLADEIARADNAEIRKVASQHKCEYCKKWIPDEQYERNKHVKKEHPKEWEKIVKSDKESSLKIQALNPLQEPPVVGQTPGQPLASPVEEAPTFDSPVSPTPESISEPEFLEAPKEGDRVYVMGDYETGDNGFEGTMVSEYTSRGDKYAVVSKDDGDNAEVALHRVVKASQKKVAKAYYEKKAEHEHDYQKGESSSVVVCPCGAFKYTEEYLREHPPIVEKKAREMTEEEKLSWDLRQVGEFGRNRDGSPRPSIEEVIKRRHEKERKEKERKENENKPEQKEADLGKKADYPGGPCVGCGKELPIVWGATFCKDCVAKGLDKKYFENKEVEANLGKKADYEGWSNYSTWGLSLLLDNDQALYNESRELAKKSTNINELAKGLSYMYFDLFEQMGETGKDIREVNWKEIAQVLLNEAKENVEYAQSQSAPGIIEKLPTVNEEEEKDKIIDLLNKEQDPEKRQKLQQRYKHLSMGSINTELQSLHESALKIKAELEHVDSIGFLFVKGGLNKQASGDSAFEANGWTRVWVDELEIEVDPKYPEILKLPDENARIAALKELAREKAHEALRLADSAGAKVGVQAWFESLTPSDHDRIDWVKLANPVSEEEEDRKFEEEQKRKYGEDYVGPAGFESSQDPKIEKKADVTLQLPCEVCGGKAKPYLGIADQMTHDLCEKCAPKFGVTEKKADDEDICSKCPKFHIPAGNPCEVEKKAADPLPLLGPSGQPLSAKPEVLTQFKHLEKAPARTEREKAQPATEEQAKLVKDVESSLSSLESIKSMIAQAKAKLNEEIKNIEQQGGRIQLEAELKERIEKLSKLVEVTQNQMVYAGDTMIRLIQETKERPFKPSDAWKVQKLVEKFAGAQEYLDKAIAGAQSLSTTEQVRDLVFFPRKVSKLHKVAGFLETLDSVYNNILEALKLVIGREEKLEPAVV